MSRMEITKDDYVGRVRDSLEDLTEEMAGELVALGSGQGFIDDNDIFDAIHAYLGSLEVPVSEAERADIIAKIKELLDSYEKEKEAR